MKIINLTGHDINIVSNIDGQWTVTKTIPSEGIARVSFDTQHIDTIDGIDIFKSVKGQTTGLPAEVVDVTLCHYCNGDTINYCPNCLDGYVKTIEDKTRYIVSKIVAEANPHRNDLLIVSETVRDGATILGCKGLSIL